MTSTGTAGPGAAEPARRPAARPAATPPLTRKPHKPCSNPPNRRRRAYDHSPATGPDRARRAQRHSTQPKQVRVELPQQPPPLTPPAALALFRVLLNTRVTHHGQTTDQPRATPPDQLATDPERKG